MTRRVRAGHLAFGLLTLAFTNFQGQIPGQIPLPEDRGAAGFSQSLKRLQTTASAMVVAAHPDDEDGPLLTLLARGRGVRTSLFTINRGEGGANLISDLRQDRLGLLRTLELLEAGRHYGLERQFFSRAVDYGFSKTISEAIEKWGTEAVLGDLVRAIRSERPDVLISRFRADQRDGGGHATAHYAGMMARMAFDAAGDASRFPEQIAQGLHPWQPRKLYYHSSRPDSKPDISARWTVTADAGQYDALLGRSYFEIARQGLHTMGTQGMASRLSRTGPFPIRYELVESRLDRESPDREESFFDGLDASLHGIAAEVGQAPPSWLTEGLKALQGDVDAAAGFEGESPERCIPHLTNGLRRVRLLIVRASPLEMGPAGDRVRLLLRRKEGELQKAVRQALGLDFRFQVEPEEPQAGPPWRTHPTFGFATPGQRFSARMTLINRSGVTIDRLRFSVAAPSGWRVARGSTGDRVQQPENGPERSSGGSFSVPAEPQALGRNETAQMDFRIGVPRDARPGRPHWFRSSTREFIYRYRHDGDPASALPAPPITGVATIRIDDVEIEVREPLRVVRFNPRSGASFPPLEVAPALSVRFDSDLKIVVAELGTFPAVVIVHSASTGPTEGEVVLELPDGWSSVPGSHAFRLSGEGGEKRFEFQVKIPKGPLPEERSALRAVARAEQREYREGFETISAPGLGWYNSFSDAIQRVRRIEVAIEPDLRVGYVMGSGDPVPKALERLGVEVSLLERKDLEATDLRQFDALLIGVRGYAVRPDLAANNERLLEYARRGGVLVVQYQTPEFEAGYGPFPYSMGDRPEEVSEESAPVTLLEPGHFLLQYPNEIGSQDFQGWVVERGSKFLARWDLRYRPLLEMSDRRQTAQRGGLLVARYGEGIYVYCALALYRQLPEGVPGGFRLLANLVSLARNPHR